jgi:hypothetical protein
MLKKAIIVAMLGFGVAGVASALQTNRTECIDCCKGAQCNCKEPGALCCPGLVCKSNGQCLAP